MIDLHMHTFFSDGVLSPFELVYRAKSSGCSAIALTDHVDYSNMEFVISNIVKAARVLTESYGILVLPGAELTYIPPKLIKSAVGECRRLGAKVVVVHGETIAEVVPPGTNICAVEACVDILAHPGRLSEGEARAAAKNNVKIEVSTRKRYGATNREIVEIALKEEAKLVLDTDTHGPEDLLTKELIARILSESGLPLCYYDIMQKNALEIVNEYS
ncbi:MAG: histidinol phosphate phosphatase domain-containing protein [Endomicrobium sp.]|jgi:histidinol phosphatase-like PHP family hydrolase|nr:histidinol phosphate phosphatase domain-containing protein [Endomicrobium sp.]